MCGHLRWYRGKYWERAQYIYTYTLLWNTHILFLPPFLNFESEEEFLQQFVFFESHSKNNIMNSVSENFHTIHRTLLHPKMLLLCLILVLFAVVYQQQNQHWGHQFILYSYYLSFFSSDLINFLILKFSSWFWKLFCDSEIYFMILKYILWF